MAAVNAVPPHIQRTTHLTPRAVAVRKQLLEATEPDELIFKAIPAALELKSVPAQGAYPDSRKLVLRLGRVFDEINEAYPKLLGELRSELSEALGVRVPSESLQQHLVLRAAQLEGQVINPNLKKFVSALKTGPEGDDQWIEYVAMHVAGGTPPKHWTDDDRARYRVELRDVAGTFLRVESLNADLLTKSDGFDAFRVAVTKSGGDERVILIPVDHQHRPALEQIVSTAIQQVADQGLSDTAARDALIALLADTASSEGAATPLVPQTVSAADVELADPGQVEASD